MHSHSIIRSRHGYVSAEYSTYLCHFTSEYNGIKTVSLPISVVDDRVDDGVHLFGEFQGVGREFLSWRTSSSLLGLGAPIVSAREVFVLTSFAFALFQADFFLHFLQVSILDSLKQTVYTDSIAITQSALTSLKTV